MNNSKPIKTAANTKIIRVANSAKLIKEAQSEISRKQSFNGTNKAILDDDDDKLDINIENETTSKPIYSNQTIDSINNFSLRFYLNLKHFSNLSDYFISPLSIYYILHLFYSCSEKDDELYVELEKVLNIKKEQADKSLYEVLKNVFTANFTMNNKTHVIRNYLLDQFRQILKADYNSILIEDSKKLSEITRQDTKVLMVLLNDLNFDLEINYIDCSFSYKPLGLPLKLYEYPFNDENFVLNLVFCEEKNIDDKLFKNLSFFNDVLNELKPIKSLDNPKIQIPKIIIENDQSTFINNIIDLGVKSLANCDDIQKYGLNVNEANFTSIIQIESNRIFAKCQTRFDLKRDIDNSTISNNIKSLNGETNLNSSIVIIRNKKENLILFMGKYSK